MKTTLEKDLVIQELRRLRRTYRVTLAALIVTIIITALRLIGVVQ